MRPMAGESVSSFDGFETEVDSVLHAEFGVGVGRPAAVGVASRNPLGVRVVGILVWIGGMVAVEQVFQRVSAPSQRRGEPVAVSDVAHGGSLE